MKILAGFCLALALTISAAAADVSGKWTGSFNITGPDGDTKESTAVLLLKQSGSDLSGSAGPNEDEQHPIQKGKIEGDKITLEADDNGTVIKFELMLVGDHIKGDASASRDGQSMKAKLDVMRAKA